MTPIREENQGSCHRTSKPTNLYLCKQAIAGEFEDVLDTVSTIKKDRHITIPKSGKTSCQLMCKQFCEQDQEQNLSAASEYKPDARQRCVVCAIDIHIYNARVVYKTSGR